MTDGISTIEQRPHAGDAQQPWFTLGANAVVAALGTDAERGLDRGDAAERLNRYGPNRITGEKPPSPWAVALQQLRDPMNIMLIAVVAVSAIIGEFSTAIIVGLLILLNVVLGSRQELKARASVDALAKLQVPEAKVVRDGDLLVVPAVELVPGDIVHVEPGDLVPADGRVLRSATLETQEAALTGESTPVAKDANVLPAGDVPLGDRSNVLFQNTSVTRGTATMAVTETGMRTAMGQIATMLTQVKRTRSPLQRELDALTKVLGIIAWTAVAFIVVVGLIRGMALDQVLLLGTAMAISAIPTGLPAFVSGLLAYGAKNLAHAKAVVNNLTDVETLGATSAINTDKTGTLTMNEMMVTVLYAGGAWFTVDGEGYRKTGALRSAAGTPVPDFTRLGLGLALDSDATVGDDGTVVGDPTEAALVVLAAKLGVDTEETRRTYPRLAEVPFDSEYKFMATFHRYRADGVDRVIELVKGAPDVVLARCSQAGGPMSGVQVPIDETRSEIDGANRRMGGQGLRVLAFAARFIEADDVPMVTVDPMSLTRGLGFVGMVGIVDPLRTEAIGAVGTALRAGIDVRMITGDHAVTAQAIGKSLGLGPGAISGPELQQLSDDELMRRLPELHVFGRVSPEDKLRLARIMQRQGLIVAMTGDAVNDAAALKQADIGVAMGSGSEVTKQAARMILTDDNFGTLVRAVEIGRRVYEKIVAYVRYQMIQLLALVMLFVVATAFNINKGVALTPSMVLFLFFFATAIGVVIIAIDPGDPEVMHRPPRDPQVPIINPGAVLFWVIYAAVLFGSALVPLVAGPDEPRTDAPSAALTMAFVVMGLGTVGNALVNRRDPTSGLLPPILKAAAVELITVVLIILATRVDFLQQSLLTQPLTGPQWLACLGLALVLPTAIEVGKWIRRSRTPQPPVDPERAVAPQRGRQRDRTGRPARGLSRQGTVMAKHKHGKDNHGDGSLMVAPGAEADSDGAARPRMKNKEYRRELRSLHGELVAMQEWVKKSGAKVCILFEGRDTAGKGGTIKAITERVSPRVFHVIALPAPTARERSQMYIQRYVPHLPGAGDVVIFDRSWYNRAGVERVMGFCSEEQAEQFLQVAPGVEKAIVDSGIILLKYWLEVSPDEQTRRLESRINDPRKVWKLSDLDLKSYSRWYDYSRARDDMFRATDTSWAPWFVAHTDDKKRGRLNIITHLLANVPYHPLQHKDVTLPKRQKPDGYEAPSLTVRHIPAPF